MQTVPTGPANWSLLQKIAFRFSCIYFLLYITPWTWLDNLIPGIRYITEYYWRVIEWIVKLFNKYWFHFEETTIVNNGSGDTSLDWEVVFTFLSLAILGCLIWTVLDRKRKDYTVASYWLRTFLRYFIIIQCFRYGIDKFYALQMPFPNAN